MRRGTRKMRTKRSKGRKMRTRKTMKQRGGLIIR